MYWELKQKSPYYPVVTSEITHALKCVMSEANSPLYSHSYCEGQVQLYACHASTVETRTQEVYLLTRTQRSVHTNRHLPSWTQKVAVTSSRPSGMHDVRLQCPSPGGAGDRSIPYSEACKQGGSHRLVSASSALARAYRYFKVLKGTYLLTCLLPSRLWSVPRAPSQTKGSRVPLTY